MEDSRFKTNKLTASQARQQADTTHSLFNRIYKQINESSKDGLCWLEWAVEGYSIPLVNALVADLKLYGYEVTLNCQLPDDISWRKYSAAEANKDKKLVSLTITW